jgi:hypothetical protein
MSFEDSASSIRASLSAYRQETINAASREDREDYKRVATIAASLVSELELGDTDKARLSVLAFSRAASDSTALQPRSFRPLSDAVQQARRLLTP